jgi:hypothetical protein
MGSRDLTFDILFIGHSLLGPVMPTILETAATAMSGAGQVEAQIINGAPVIYNWEHSADEESEHARRALPTGEYEIGVIAEALSLLKHLTRSDMSE